jgi:hypothetical protein
MAHRAGVRGDCAPEKLRAAEDQQAHAALNNERSVPAQGAQLSSFFSSIT